MMKKIPSLFKRNYDGDRQVYDEVVPGSEWVLAGGGTPTVKWDGTSCMVDESQNYWKRYQLKKGKDAPKGFVQAGPEDPVTGNKHGWVPVSNGPENNGSISQDLWHWEAFNRTSTWRPGTYELVGPKVQGNPYGLKDHVLLGHGQHIIHMEFKLTFDGIREFLETAGIEGIVWHHKDGRMVKIKSGDFGIDWKAQRRKEDR